MLKYFAKSDSQRALTKEIVVPFNNTDIPVYPAGVKFEQDSPGRVKLKHIGQTRHWICSSWAPEYPRGGILCVFSVDSWCHGLVVPWSLPIPPSSVQNIHSWSILDISHNLPTGREQPRSPCLASELLSQFQWPQGWDSSPPAAMQTSTLTGRFQSLQRDGQGYQASSKYSCGLVTPWRCWSPFHQQ